MNKTEKQKLTVGLVVTALLVAVTVAILSADKSGKVHGEYILITELPAGTDIQPGASVMLAGQKAGEVDKVSSSGPKSAVQVKMWVRPEIFRRIGDDAVAWVEFSSNDETIIHLEAGAKGSSRKLIKIKTVRGAKQPHQFEKQEEQ